MTCLVLKGDGVQNIWRASTWMSLIRYCVWTRPRKVQDSFPHPCFHVPVTIQWEHLCLLFTFLWTVGGSSHCKTPCLPALRLKRFSCHRCCNGTGCPQLEAWGSLEYQSLKKPEKKQKRQWTKVIVSKYPGESFLDQPTLWGGKGDLCTSSEAWSTVSIFQVPTNQAYFSLSASVSNMEQSFLLKIVLRGHLWKQCITGTESK